MHEYDAEAFDWREVEFPRAGRMRNAAFGRVELRERVSGWAQQARRSALRHASRQVARAAPSLSDVNVTFSWRPSLEIPNGADLGNQIGMHLAGGIGSPEKAKTLGSKV